MIDPANIDAILFDLDGTLVDTDDAAVDRLAARLSVFRALFPARSPRPLARWLMMQAETPVNTAFSLLDRLGLDGPLTAASARWHARRGSQGPTNYHPIDGVPQMLAELAGRYKLALVTTRSTRHLTALQTAHPEITTHLEAMIGRQHTRRIKPHPAPLQLAATKLRVPIERCLMVGDTPVDIQAARRAGAWSVGVLCGFGEQGELERAGAHMLLGCTADLAEIL